METMATADPLERLAAPPIFVIGKARSGTTWVYDILTSHPEVAGVFESWLFTDASGIGALFKERNWAKSHTGLLQLMSEDEFRRELREVVGRWLARALESEHRFLVEKSPGLHLATIAEIFPEARVIHCLRDGRDVAVSIQAAARSWAPQWRRQMGRNAFAAARAWRKVIDEVRAAEDDLGDRLLEVRYEELKADPFGGYRRIFEFCDIPYDDRLLDDIFESTDFDRAWSGGEDAFRRAGRVGDWEARFGPLDALLFDLGAGRTLVAEGFEERRSWWLRHTGRRALRPFRRRRERSGRA